MIVTSIFVSRDIGEIPELIAWCRKRNVRLTAISLITFKEIPFVIPRPYDVVFFSSVRAVEYFFKNSSLPVHCEIACVGAKTGQALASRGHTVAFTGKMAGNPEETAKDFVKWLGKKSVLIPHSTASKRTIAHAIPAEQRIEVAAYETIAVGQKIDYHDLYVFSSPSNYKSFLKENQLPRHGVIAWGQTTQKEIEKSGIEPVYTLTTSSETELIDWLETPKLLLGKR
jgi:uroporphyrinogen-III synthase